MEREIYAPILSTFKPKLATNMNRKMFLQEKRTDILIVAQKYGAKNLRIFGSVAREQESEMSDIDLLLEMDVNQGLLEQIAFAQELETLLGYKVDLAEEETLHPLIKERVMREAIAL